MPRVTDVTIVFLCVLPFLGQDEFFSLNSISVTFL